MNEKNSKEKMTFLQWIDNFWYHNKTATIIGLFALVIVVVGFSQCLMREDYDVFIYCVGHTVPASGATEDFMIEMEEKYAPDSNGDGKVVVNVKADKFTMVKGDNGEYKVFNPEKQVSESGSFQIELGNGDCVIYIMEPAFFNANLDYFEPLEDALGYMPENCISGKGIKLSDLKAYKKTETLKYFPEEYIICLADREDRYKEEYYNGHIEFLDNLINCREKSAK